MPLRLVRETVVVLRPDPNNEKNMVRVTPEIGKNFDFTAEEITEIVGTKDKPGVRPQALGKKDVEAETDKTGMVDDVAEAEKAKAVAAKTGAKSKDDDL